MPHTPPKSGPFAHPTSQDLGGLGVSFPVSFAQQRVWFLHYLEPTIASYNLPVAVRLTGPLDVGALEESLSEVVKRHDALRTSFPVYEGRPVQVIAPVRQVALLEIDLSGVPHRRRAERRPPVRWPSARRPDRSTWRRDRCSAPRCLRLGRDEHVLLLTMHHIVSDGWSMGVLVRELAALYDALRRGRALAAAASCRSSTPTSRSGSGMAAGRGARAAARLLEEQLAGAPRAGAADRPARGPPCRRFAAAQRARAGRRR